MKKGFALLRKDTLRGLPKKPRQSFGRYSIAPVMRRSQRELARMCSQPIAVRRNPNGISAGLLRLLSIRRFSALRMAPATNLIVFRDGSGQVSSHALATRLREAVARIGQNPTESALSSLILAGELECALSDCASSATADAVTITDSLARILLRIAPPDVGPILSTLDKMDAALPHALRVSHPEGFAYYALHPLDFADAVTSIPRTGSVAVIGIRSIGTTLSAVALAALQRQGVSASRITVRPVGHPYNRKTDFTIPQIAWVEQERRNGSSFVIVDEGPGLSGSSFLSVAEAVENCGIDPSRILLLGRHDADPEQLCASDAVRRWKRYPSRKVESSIWHNYAGQIPFGGGAWRRIVLPAAAQWPSCWPEMERVKFLSPERTHVSKFEGIGPHGERARERARALAEVGFSPTVEDVGDGMTRYPFFPNAPLAPSDLSADILEHLARYCAFRAHNFQTRRPAESLEEMVRFNFSQLMGSELT